MEGKKFQKTVEDFACGHCGVEVLGDGYTNHCPKCLWSRHVDVHPGDRAETCGGMMRPIAGMKKGEDYFITHQCEKCGFERNKKLEKEDDFDAFVSLSKKE
jgi:predicted Zn-ribbon and HTH transcriptional regulator